MNNIIDMRHRTDWYVMGLIKEHIKDLKKDNSQGQNASDIERNELALRSFLNEIKDRSYPMAA